MRDAAKIPLGFARVHEVSQRHPQLTQHPEFPAETNGWRRGARPERLMPGGWKPLTRWTKNLVLKEWGAIVGNALRTGDSKYRISHMYLEYQNVASPGDPADIPSFDREAGNGVAYFNSLSLSADRDYLRIPLTATQFVSSDETEFPEGNVAIFFAMSQGMLGVHGKPYSDVVNSTLAGGALVAGIDDSDHTRDLVLSRFYLPVDEQQVKLATSQLGLEWELEMQ